MGCTSSKYTMDADERAEKKKTKEHKKTKEPKTKAAKGDKKKVKEEKKDKSKEDKENKKEDEENHVENDVATPKAVEIQVNDKGVDEKKSDEVKDGKGETVSAPEVSDVTKTAPAPEASDATKTAPAPEVSAATKTEAKENAAEASDDEVNKAKKEDATKEDTKEETKEEKKKEDVDAKKRKSSGDESEKKKTTEEAPENFLEQFHADHPLNAVDFMRTWKHYDKDQSGYLEGKELRSFVKDVLEQKGEKTNKKTVDKYGEYMMQEFDTNHDHKIDIDELARILPKESNFLRRFPRNAQDNSNSIGSIELVAFLRDMFEKESSPMTEKQIEEYADMVKEVYEVGDDGGLTREDMKMILVKV